MDENNGLKRKVADNLLWRFLERILAQLVSFIVAVVLARILDPGAYGSVALITVFTTIFQVFVDSGLGNALIQKKNADELDFSTVFYTNIVFCIVMYLLIYIATPVISSFYNDMELTSYIRVLGLTVLISGVKNVQQAYVSRHLMFRNFFFATLGGTITAGVVGIIMALKGAGVWALIVQQVINLTIDTGILWVTVKWRPVKAFSLKRLKGLFGFGWKMLISSLLDTTYRDLRQLIIGKIYTTEDLAYYNQGVKMPKLIVSNINTSINNVLLPVMSSVQDEKDRLKSMTRRSITVSVFAMAPLMIGLAAVGEPLIKLLLTEKWLFAVPFMRIFCITYIFYPIHTANLNAIKALGRSDLFLKLEIIKKIIELVALFITMQISVMAMAYSLLFISIAGQIINAWPSKQLLDYSILEQWRDILPSIMLASFMGLCIYFLDRVGLPDIFTIAMQVVAGAVLYIGGSKILKFDSYDYVLGIAKSYLKGKKTRDYMP